MACPHSVNKIKRNTIADTWSLRIPLDFLIVSINLNAHNFILLSSFLHPVFESFPWVILCHSHGHVLSSSGIRHDLLSDLLVVDSGVNFNLVATLTGGSLNISDMVTSRNMNTQIDGLYWLLT